MAEYQGEYGHPYPRVDQYGNPVPPVDQYGNPIPREPPASGLGGAAAPPYSAADDNAAAGAGHVAAPVEYGASAGYPHDGMGASGGGIITASPGGVAAYPSGGGVAPGETALAYESMVVGAGVGGAHLQATREEEHTFGPGSQLQPTKEEHTTTLGEKLRRSGSSSSVSFCCHACAADCCWWRSDWWYVSCI